MKYLLMNLLMISVIYAISSDANQFLDAPTLKLLNITLLNGILIIRKFPKKWNHYIVNPLPITLWQ